MSSKWFNLFLSNFLGVFNDNFLKNAIIFIAIGWKLPGWLTQSQLISLVSASLVIPYLILSPAGGKLAVKYSKLKVFRFFKLLEFPIMLLAVVSFVFEWIFPAVLSVLLMGIQSCLYSPAKYGLIRDIGGVEGSAYGSGMFETMAFLGILTATVVASLLSDIYNVWMVSAVFMLLAAGGYWATSKIRVSELPAEKDTAEQMNLSPFRFLSRSYLLAKQYGNVNMAVLGVSLFWFIGGLLQMNIVIHAKNHFQVSNTATGVVMAFAAIGIALGSWLAGVLASRIRERHLLFSGLAGMVVCLLVIVLFNIGFEVFVLMIFLTAFCGGLFQVPNLSVIQRTDSGRRLGQLLAYMNLMIFVFVLVATALFSLITYITGENSFVVFWIIIATGVLAFAMFQVKFKRV